MSDPYIWLKWVHILSATVLFGTGLGTAFQMWITHMRGNVAAIAVTSRNVVLADWLFTLPSGIIQPVTGAMLIANVGYGPHSSWLSVSYALYAIALICWLPVVWLQIKIAKIANESHETNSPLPPLYFIYMRRWLILGWPAFIALLAVFYLMIAKPELW